VCYLRSCLHGIQDSKTRNAMITSRDVLNVRLCGFPTRVLIPAIRALHKISIREERGRMSFKVISTVPCTPSFAERSYSLCSVNCDTSVLLLLEPTLALGASGSKRTQYGVRHVCKVVIVQQESCHLPHGGLPNSHSGFQSGLPQSSSNKTLQ